MKNDELVLAIEEDWTKAGLSPRRVAMLEYAVKLTSFPQGMAERDVRKLRGVGFTDTDILQICEVVAYYAYVNRIADGLGVELES